MATKKGAGAVYEYCHNCGLHVEGTTAKRAANPVAVFCCACGLRLKPDGTCKNELCKFVGQIPNCT